jgi:catechol 2,3-dioxygenase-like lactoylglutathione lyase family enzyme
MNASSLSLSAVSLTVSDVSVSLAFYRRLGLVIPEDSVWPSDDAGHHVAVEMPGGTLFELDSAAMTASYDPLLLEAPAAGATTLIFSLPPRHAVDDLDTEMTSAGYRGHLAPFDAFWGARYAVINDPDGNRVGIMSPMEEQHQSAPPML